MFFCLDLSKDKRFSLNYEMMLQPQPNNAFSLIISATPSGTCSSQ
jgi:hypothetical protein